MKFRWPLLVPLVALVLAALFFYFWLPHEARLEHRKGPDGSPMMLAIPANDPAVRVLIVATEALRLSDEQMASLAEENQARAVQLVFPADDCAAQQRQIAASIDLLGATPDLVAGIDNGAAYAWRWLSTQGNDKARAISVGFSLARPDCSANPLPTSATHGEWVTAWNENPDPDTSRFVRDQPRTENVIGNYGTPLVQILFTQLKRSLQGQGDPVPVIEVPAAKPSDLVTFFYSGDGGWRDLDRASAQYMASQGYPVVGIDALRYFWQHKSPEQVTADLEQLMQTYRDKWGAKRFVLAGYSFGADILPIVYNRLPARDQEQVQAMLLLALARTGSFEIEVQGWLGQAGEETVIGPELAKIPAQKVFCVYGSEDADDSGCTLPGAPGETLRLPGGHHFDEDYEALARHLLDAIRQRTKE
ncbi:virulence factor family protein [Azomonas macrocytogenes]|uniref:Type IV secretory pathway VirJ component n=1 Tax=Azomonas macrocytogenes TaxID=69962 RepID=A0A839T4Z3_AZOMA|nr:virulence factor family protein [Azomonas macrocytogenes]MBB3103384.1 type IV secretory pathway VirJ component [Azomonas macrocytogenes]